MEGGAGVLPRSAGLTDTAPTAPSQVFATPSPRLIPKGKKPDTFTGLALAPFEGRT
jgi:hypothetical protein